MTTELQASYTAFQKNHPRRICRVGGQDWEYIDAGSGPALLMLPGFFGVAGTDFQYILAFESQYRVVSLSYPEAGASAAELAGGLAGLMDELDIQRAHLLGGSYSGYLAQVFVRRYPQRVRGLILAQTGPPRRRHIPPILALAGLCRGLPPGVLRRLMRRTVRYFLPHATPEQDFWRAYFLELIDGFPKPALCQRFRVALDYHRHYRFAPGDLDGWPGTILILESQGEDFLSQEDGRRLRQIYPQAQVCRLAGDHVGSVDQPQAQIEAIARYLQDNS